MIVKADKTEYCRYEIGKNVITLTAVDPSLIEGATVLFAIRRQPSHNWPDEYRNIMTKTLVVSALDVTAGSISASFTLGIDDVDNDGIARCISGLYDGRVTIGAEYWQTTTPIMVSLVSMEEIKNDWCHGVSLRSSEVNAIKFQPKLITGVTILELSPDTFVGPKNLVLEYELLATTPPAPSWTIAWDGGVPTPIVPAMTGEYLLTDEGELNYAMAQIDATLLPTANITERLLVIQAEMKTDMITRRVKNAMNTIESQLGFAIEPQRYTTMPIWPGRTLEHQYQTDHWDRVGRAADYIVPIDGYKWPQFRMPYQWLLKLHRLFGFHSVDKITQVEGDWWSNSIDRMSGYVTLTPALASFARWTVFTHPMLAPFFMHRNIAGFWQYDATFGLPDLSDPDRQVVRELLARTAAISILTEAARAAQGGIASESTSRDGISNSRSYNPGGMYSPTIQAHQQWLMVETPRIKAKLGGILFGMLGDA